MAGLNSAINAGSTFCAAQRPSASAPALAAQIAGGMLGTACSPLMLIACANLRHSRRMETISDWMPSRCQAPFRYRGRLRRFPMTFDDSDMFLASQRCSILRPSR